MISFLKANPTCPYLRGGTQILTVCWIVTADLQQNKTSFPFKGKVGVTAIKLRTPPSIGGRWGGGAAAERSRKSTRDDGVTPPLPTCRIFCWVSAGFPLPIPPRRGRGLWRVDP